MILIVLFWILFLLSVIGIFSDGPNSPVWVGRGSRVVLLILIGILGLKVFGNPIS